MPEGRASLDLQAQLGEEFGRHAHHGHVPDDHRLHPRGPLLAHARSQVLAHLPEDVDHRVGVARASLVAVVGHRLVLGRLVKTADLEDEGPLEAGHPLDLLRPGLGQRGQHGLLDRRERLLGRLAQRMGRAAGALQESGRAAQLRLQRLGHHAVEGRRADIAAEGADRVRRVPEKHRLELARGVAEGQHGQVGVKGAGRPDRVVARPDPIDRPVPEHQPAVAADRVLLAQGERERGLGQPGLGVDHRLHDRGPQPLDERLAAVVAVDPRRARGMVRVRGVDHHVGGRNARATLDFGQCRIDEIAGHEEHVARDDRHGRFLAACNQEGRGPELAFLALDEPGQNAAGDGHRVIGLDLDRRNPHA